MKAAIPSARLRERDSSNKENEPDVPAGKKRKLGISREPAARAPRETLSALNVPRESIASIQASSVPAVPSTVSSGQVEWEGVARMASDEVEALLNTKMAGKSKFDLKGRNEKMMEYIKNLRTCIRQFLQVESVYVMQQEQAQNQIKEEKQRHEESEQKMSAKYGELEAKLVEARQQYDRLVGQFQKLETEKQELSLAHAKDVEALEVASEERTKLNEEIDKLQKEVAQCNHQLGTAQDVNRRLQEYNTSLQLYNSKLQSDAALATEENAKTQKEKAAIVETLGALRGNYAGLQTQLETAKDALQAETAKMKSINDELSLLRAELLRVSEERDNYYHQVQALSAENAAIREKTSTSAAEIMRFTSKAEALEESYDKQAEQIRLLQKQLNRSKEMLEVAEKSLSFERIGSSEYMSKIEALENKLADAEQQLREGEMLRRKLHNTIQELKGNIRVFCRVRPLLPDENDESSTLISYPGEEGIELHQAQGQTYSFSFDKTFGPDVSQRDVFTEISQLVQSALDGYKVCIFAYGQTGSGKTHTMIGQPDDMDQKGVIPRSLEQIFQCSQALRSQGWSFKMQASLLEIYNETIRDLLAPSKSVGGDTTPAKQHAIKHEPTGNTVVTELTVVEVNSWEEVSSLLRQAAQSRTVGKTAMNDRSSRSHCVFTLRIIGSNENTEQQVQGVLNLIDLAGSERLSKSGSTGERLKETQAINKSLSSLGDVILAIANKDPHIPYRNSKLTYLLQPCLGGDSKTLMFVNISPDSKSLHESLCSLRFAAKVNACEIGVPRRYTSSRPQISC
ncbi:kinesin-like protein KIN-14N [Selaginella moellendorffii]|uniref:kinesin-like protein KIN-14N n=1 Tax=Selaginella moellendorffii TaxID=88036 RepID=UPI000D1C89AC|nr:kinesin-like protein KIN-14N [Selaginella moellendorffii]|eukprot:XP_024526400.1 kinesin-like protein KIN-14N [Selaginella moellendorffii]